MRKILLFIRLLFMRPSRRAQVRRNLQAWREALTEPIERRDE